ncbi:MAG: DUF1080 domain-containing protein [Pirellulales bacterium]
MPHAVRAPFFFLVLSLIATATAHAEDDDWKPLFNGKDLTGWKAIDGPADAWKVIDGNLSCSGGGGGWLSTTEEYANFEIALEFRVPPGGNSGVFLRSPHQGNPAYAGMEVQVLDDGADEYKNLQPAQYCGSVYGIAAAMPRVTKKPGDWQTMRIVCDRRRVKVWINGTQVVDTNLDEHLDQAAEHPGIKRTTGYLGLQNHGSQLDYRKLRIRELP